jgi:hypothetical protein
MQRADNFNPCGDFSGRFELAQTFIAGGDDLGKVLVERKGADVS